MCDIADARSKRTDDGSSTPVPWRQVEDGLWALAQRPGSLRVIERCGDGDYVVHSGHRSSLGRFPSLSVAMSAATAAAPAAVA